jgi:hypothetical protein
MCWIAVSQGIEARKGCSDITGPSKIAGENRKCALRRRRGRIVKNLCSTQKVAIEKRSKGWHLWGN